MARTNKTDNRGTTLVNVPIQFHLGSVKLDWQIIREKTDTLFVGLCPPRVSLENVKLGDGWNLVRRFLSVRADDEKSILEFVVANGWLELPEELGQISKAEELRAVIRATQPNEGTSSKKPNQMIAEAFSLRSWAKIQDYIRRMLISRKPTLPTPWNEYIQRYEIAFANARSGCQAHVSVNRVFPSIRATVQFKLLQGAVFRFCARKDCCLPFEVTSRHTRLFCTQYCAHITSLRQRRKAEHQTRTTKKGI